MKTHILNFLIFFEFTFSSMASAQGYDSIQCQVKGLNLTFSFPEVSSEAIESTLYISPDAQPLPGQMVFLSQKSGPEENGLEFQFLNDKDLMVSFGGSPSILGPVPEYVGDFLVSGLESKTPALSDGIYPQTKCSYISADL